jgi:polyvinyl alcohol dehydrogenase (cytochrome)
MRILILAAFVAGRSFPQDGAQVYAQACARCHDSGASRAPLLEALRRLPAQAILDALERGSMRFAGQRMPAGQRKAVAEYVAAARVEARPVHTSADNACPAESSLGNPREGPRWIGWGASTGNLRFQPAAMAGLSIQSLPKLQLKWAFGFPNTTSASGAPAVAGGRLYTGSRAGTVYSLDARTGCTHWTYEARGAVRAALSIAPMGGRYAVWLGDSTATVYCLNAATGVEIWKTKVDEHPAAVITGSPVFHDGRLYVPVSSFEEASGTPPTYSCCKFRGSVVALEAATGKQIWKSYTIAEIPRPTRKNNRGVQLFGPSGAAIWSAPTIDEKRGRLYVGTGDNYSDPPTGTSDAVLALELTTGEIAWSRQFTRGDAYVIACNPGMDPANCPDSKGPDFDFGSSPILVELAAGKRALLAGQKSGWLYALDPDNGGELLWQQHPGKGGVLGGIQWGPASDGINVYAALSDLDFFTRRTSAGGISRGMNPLSGGGLFAYEIATGKRLWYAPPAACDPARPQCSPAQSAALTVIPEVVFSGSLDGHLRAYSVKDGSVLWDYDTRREYETVNRVKASGGALNAAGPVIVDGMLYVNSGYGQFGAMPGNVLLAFQAKE